MPSGSWDMVRDLNTTLVLDQIRRRGPITRVTLTERTRLGKSTITEIVSRLVQAGLVTEVGQAASMGGRPPTLLDLNPEAGQVVAVKIGPPGIHVALSDLKGRLRSGRRAGLPGDRKAILPVTEAEVRRLLDETGAAQDSVLGVSVVLPGVVDPVRGSVRAAYFLGWDEFPIKRELEERLGLPVHLDNDANALGLAEYLYGAGRGSRALLVVTLGAGIGGAVILNGEVYHGAFWGAGEIGHMPAVLDGPQCGCGRQGCLEAVASDRALLKAVSDAAQEGGGSLPPTVDGVHPEALTVEAVVEAARRGDELSRRALSETALHVGRVLGGVVNLLNPDRIVIGGERALAARELILTPLKTQLERHAFADLGAQARLALAETGTDGWLLGAAAELLEEVFKIPPEGTWGRSDLHFSKRLGRRAP